MEIWSWYIDIEYIDGEVRNLHILLEVLCMPSVKGSKIRFSERKCSINNATHTTAKKEKEISKVTRQLERNTLGHGGKFQSKKVSLCRAKTLTHRTSNKRVQTTLEYT